MMKLRTTTIRLRLNAALFFTAVLFLSAHAAMAEQTPSYQFSIKNQAFKPSTLTIPAGKQVKLRVKNEDAIPAEFESYDFNREKVIPGHSQVDVYVGPMKAGTYGFFNDFHRSSKGKLIVK